MSELPITDEEILKYARQSYHAMRGIKAVKQQELRRRQKEKEKKESMERDNTIAKKFIGATVESTEIVEYRVGEYSDYNPTVVKLYTNKGVFFVNDPGFDSSVETIKGEEK